MFERIEIRQYSYANRTTILHIDRRKEFHQKLQEKMQANQDNKDEFHNNLEEKVV